MTPEIVNKYNVATTLLNKKKYDKAGKLFKEIVKDYGFKEAWLNYGNCLKFSDKDTLAMQCYQKANDPTVPYLDQKMDKTKPYTLALNNIGLMNFTYGRDLEAIISYDTALSVEPEFYDAMWNKATAALKTACSHSPDLFPIGWNLYESRFKKNPPVQLKSDKKVRLWQGETGVSVIVLAEQGIGDNIMFYRYLEPLEKKYNIKLIFQCDHTLKTIIPTDRPTCFLTTEVSTDLAIPCGSLPMLLDSQEIPSAPYFPMSTPHELDNTRPNIGFVYSGSNSHANDRHRSVSAQRFKRFTKYGNMYHFNPGAVCPPWAKDIKVKSWADTCRWLSSIDILISVDTSLVHMAGAMGIPTIMVQPFKETDFRWGNDSMGSRNVWYPSVSVIRNPQDWDFTFNMAEETLKEMI